jgi:hypothetical protein
LGAIVACLVLHRAKKKNSENSDLLGLSDPPSAVQYCAPQSPLPMPDIFAVSGKKGRGRNGKFATLLSFLSLHFNYILA